MRRFTVSSVYKLLYKRQLAHEERSGQSMCQCANCLLSPDFSLLSFTHEAEAGAASP